jgi:anthranilate synthase/aminodeoxychorismate synthase-like glutamine amidotransferase
MILLLDNYDSFVHNVARYLRRIGREVEVVRSDSGSAAELLAMEPSHVVISPGPCTPDEAGVCVALVREAADTLPILGICLGHQVVGAAFGASIVPSPEPVHGASREIFHGGGGVFRGLPSPFPAGLYHSLSVAPGSLPPELVAEGWSSSGELMALRHATRPVWGVQFHPESILTPTGLRIFRNFVEVEESIPPGPALTAGGRGAGERLA